MWHPAIYRFNNTLNIDERWQTTLVNIIDVHVPKAKARNSDTPPWIDAEIIHLLYKRKETARQASKRSNSPALRNKYKELRKVSLYGWLTKKSKNTHSPWVNQSKIIPSVFGHIFVVKQRLTLFQQKSYTITNHSYLIILQPVFFFHFHERWCQFSTWACSDKSK